MSFSEVREYMPGDDVKAIDWNVTARFSHPFVKVYEEERELTVILLVDISSSSLFGLNEKSKRELITEVAAVLAFAANTNNDKVGVIFFSDRVDKYIPPKKGKSHVLRIIRDLIALEAKPNAQTNVNFAIEFLNTVLKKKTISFILSDFISPNFEKSLMLAARKHDFVGINTYDPNDAILPKLGLIQVQDAETGQVLWIDTEDKNYRNKYQNDYIQHQKYCKQIFFKSGASLLSVATNTDYIKALQGYFKSR